MSATNRFQTVFSNPNQKVFIPFFVLGYPDKRTSLEIIKGVIDLGIGALELGIPFSDPIADGPQNQLAMSEALRRGLTFQDGLDMLQEIRAYAPDLPIGLLLYYNLIFYQGAGRVYQKLSDIGVDALVCPELPIEEATAHEAQLAKYGLGCVHMVFPNTPDMRAQKAFEHSTAFTYVVARLGPTGASTVLSTDTEKRIKHLRTFTDKPMVVGFGLSQPDHVKAVFDAGSNGAIVASRFTKEIAQADDPLSVLKLIKEYM